MHSGGGGIYGRTESGQAGRLKPIFSECMYGNVGMHASKLEFALIRSGGPLETRFLRVHVRKRRNACVEASGVCTEIGLKHYCPSKAAAGAGLVC